MNLQFIIIRVLLGATFLISGLAKLYSIEEFELSIMETGLFNWTSALLLSRIIISSEIILGLAIIFKIYFRLSLILSILILIVFSFYLGYLIFFKPLIEDCGCFGDLIKMSPETSLIKNSIMVALSFLLLKINKNEIDNKFFRQEPKRIFILFFILSFTLTFVVFPISQANGIAYERDNEMLLPHQKFYLNGKFYEEINLKDQRKIVGFFSLKCKHCKAAGRKFKIMNDKNPKIVPYIIFAGTGSTKNMSDLKKFQQETGTQTFPYSFMEKEKFLETGGYSFPAIYFIENGKVLYKHDFLSLTQENLKEFVEGSNVYH
jgi:hypothetical protein